MESKTDYVNTRLPLIVVVGANGFVGRNLVRALLDDGRYRVRAVVRDLNNLKLKHEHLEVVLGDVTSTTSLKIFLREAEVAFYLVHMLTSKAGSLYQNEAKMAENFGSVAQLLGVKRVVYLSGLGSDRQKLSKHLASRHNTGDILRQYLPEVIELRASVIVGPGSISFEIIRSVIKRLPIIILPKEAQTLTQPIGLPDVIKYLVSSIQVTLNESKIIEIGGTDQFSYQTFLQAYAKFLGKKRFIFSTTILPLSWAGFFLYLFLPKEIAKVGQNMVESFQNEMIVTNNIAKELFPDILPKPAPEYFTT